MAEIDSNYKYLTYEEMAKDVAEQALDEVLYDGKSIREWIQIIASEDVISRQAVLEIIRDFEYKNSHEEMLINSRIKELQPVTPAEKQKPCEDCISREEAIKPFMVDATEEWTSADIVKYLKSLLSVMPTWRYPQVPGITPIVVPVERIPNHQQLKKLDTEILVQAGIYNSKLKENEQNE